MSTGLLERPTSAEVSELPSTELTGPERHHMKLQAIVSGSDAIVSIFLSLYLFDIGGTSSVASFFAVKYFTLTVGFVIAGKLMRHRSTRSLMRAGLLSMCVVYTLLIGLGESAIHYLPLIAVLAGLGEGLYWPGVNVVEYVVTDDRTRSVYTGKLSLLCGLMSAGGPPLAGGLFTITSLFGSRNSAYYALFGVLVCLLISAWSFAGRSGHHHGVDYEARASVRRPTAEWTLVILQKFFRGMWKNVVDIFAPVLAFGILHGELHVSLFAGATTVAAAVVAVSAGHLLHRWRSTYLIGVLSVPFGLLALAVNQSWLGLVAYMLLVSCLDTFSFNAFMRAGYRAIDRAGHDWRKTYHLVVEAEAALNAGRMVGFGIVLFLIGTYGDIDAVRNGIILVAPFALIAGILQARIEKHQISPALQP